MLAIKFCISTFLAALLIIFAVPVHAANQTETTTPILPQNTLPFTISIEQASFSLPTGLHSGALAIYKDKWLFIAGRTNGLHGFNSDNNNFPPSQQNSIVYVVDPEKHKVYSRSLADPSSGLTQEQIDQLSVTSPQFFQKGKKLYISGGYGIDTATGLFNTKPVLTAIDIPKLINWVIHPSSENSAAKSIQQTSDPLLQVTGGYMAAANRGLSTLLIFGQNFTGFYTPDSDGDYTQQVRRFKIIDKKKNLHIEPLSMQNPDPNFRRRDLNVVPVILNNQPAFAALSGVFTLDGGAWTVPVTIQSDGTAQMADPSNPNTFKQGMNNYISATVGLFSCKTRNMYILSFGGISYGFFDGGSFHVDPDLPFINEVTTIKIDKRGHFSQYLMNDQFPTILSTGSHPGNPLLFGASAMFIPSKHVSTYKNGVVNLDKIKDSILLGYIVGGIMSTLPETQTISDSTASPYIFRVMLNK